MHRRHLLMGALAGASAAVTVSSAGAQTPYLQSSGGGSQPPAPPAGHSADVWASVRAEFNLSPDYVDLSAMLLASHPRAVREAVATYRDALDRQPVLALKDNRDLQNASRSAVAKYLGTRRNDIALTDSTTSAVALVFNGLKLSHGDEILTVDQDYYVIHESARYVAVKRGAKVRRIALYGGSSRAADADQMVQRVIGAIRPETRVLALTWVHSSTGVKLPIGRIAEALRPINAGRPENRRIIFCVDGAHGFGNQDAGMPELGCDFLMSGCHKWLFGPRGTGMIAGSSEGWNAVDPTIPSFLDSGAYSGWISGSYAARATGSLMTPGGFKPFEHLWALSSAFDLHDRVGRPAIAARTAELAGMLKEGIAGLPNATLHTPMSSEMSAGIVSFDVTGMTPAAAVERLRDRRIMASMAPYARQLVRLTPSIRNSPEDLDRALREVRALG